MLLLAAKLAHWWFGQVFLQHTDVQVYSRQLLLLGKQGKQNDAFCSCKLTEWTDMHEKIWMGNIGLYINYLQLWCDYRIDGYSLKRCVMFSSFSNTYANLKVPINQYVNQLNNVKGTVCWQAYYHLGSCRTSFCPPQSCILFPTAPEPAKAVDPAKETEEIRIFSCPE